MTATRDRLVTEAATPGTKGHRHSRPNTTPLSSHSLMPSPGATAIPFRALRVLILIPGPKVAPFLIRIAVPVVLASTNIPTNTPTRPSKASPGPSPRCRSTSSSVKSRPPRMRPITMPTPQTRPVNLPAPRHQAICLPTPRALSIAVGTPITTRTRSIAPPIPPTRRATNNPTPVPNLCPSLCPFRLRLNKAAGASFWLRGTRSVRAQNMAISTRICCCRGRPWVR